MTQARASASTDRSDPNGSQTKPDPMSRALDLARMAINLGEVPVGAVITDAGGNIIAEACNRTITDLDPTAHAEILALRRAGAALGSARLVGCTLWVTLEPCPMCSGALEHARISRVVFAAYDPKGGGLEHGPQVLDHTNCRHRPEIIGGVREQEAADILRDFFRQRR